MARSARPIRARRSLTAWKLKNREQRDEVPPLFEIAPTTKVLALMAHVGPVSRNDLELMRPGINVRRATASLKPYIEAGLVIKFRQDTLLNEPELWGLNPNHRGAERFRALLRSYWWAFMHGRVVTRHSPKHRVPKRLRHRASSAPRIYRRAGYRDYSDLLHLLAEFKGPVPQTPLAHLLGADIASFGARMNVLVMFGLVEESYKGGQRYFLMAKTTLGAALRTWCSYVNRHSDDGEILRRAEFYRAQRKRTSQSDWAERKRRRSGARFKKRTRPELAERLDRKDVGPETRETKNPNSGGTRRRLAPITPVFQ